MKTGMQCAGAQPGIHGGGGGMASQPGSFIARSFSRGSPRRGVTRPSADSELFPEPFQLTHNAVLKHTGKHFRYSDDLRPDGKAGTPDENRPRFTGNPRSYLERYRASRRSPSRRRVSGSTVRGRRNLGNTGGAGEVRETLADERANGSSFSGSIAEDGTPDGKLLEPFS